MILFFEENTFWFILLFFNYSFLFFWNMRYKINFWVRTLSDTNILNILKVRDYLPFTIL